MENTQDKTVDFFQHEGWNSMIYSVHERRLLTLTIWSVRQQDNWYIFSKRNADKIPGQRRDTEKLILLVKLPVEKRAVIVGKLEQSL